MDEESVCKLTVLELETDEQGEKIVLLLEMLRCEEV